MLAPGFGRHDDVVWRANKKEGLTSFTTVPTVTQPTYASAADNRAVVNVRNNLFFDFVGMNLVDIDYNSLNDNYEVTVVNRKGQQFNFNTKYNDIPAIDSTFFKQDALANLSGTYPNFVYDTDWQSAGTNLKILSVPYKDANSVDNTFLVIWDNSNKSNGLYLLEVDLYTLTASKSKASYAIKPADFQPNEYITNTAKQSGETTLPNFASSSGGLPFIYTSSSLSVASTLFNSTLVLQSRTKVRNRHYYYRVQDPNDANNKLKVYPYLSSITPFVYFNPANGDLVVLDGSFNTRAGGSGTYTSKTSFAANDEVELETETDYAGMIKTSRVRRYRRPIDPNNLVLSDYKDATALAYDIMIEATNDDSRDFNDTDIPYTTRVSLAFVPSLSMSIVNSPLDKRMVYHLTTGSVSVLIVLARQGTALAIEKIRTFESQMDKQNDYISTSSTIGLDTTNTYQNPAALSTGKSSTSSSSSSGSGTSSSSGSGTSSSSGSSSGTSSTGTSADALSALEKKAIYDVISKLIFSRDSYFTSAGYTTKNCPACEVNKTTTTTTKTENKNFIDKIKDRRNVKSGEKNKKEEEEEEEEADAEEDTEPDAKSDRKPKTAPKPGSATTLPPYQTQSETAARFASSSVKSDENPHEATNENPEELQNVAKTSTLAKETTVAAAPKTQTRGSSSSSIMTSAVVDAYLRRPPNPNYKAPMPTAFDFSKIGWQT